MATLSAFLPYVLPHVPGCTDPLAEQAVRLTCIEFCTETMLVQDIVTATVVQGIQDYDMTPSGLALVRILGVMVGDRWLEPLTTESIHSGVALRGVAIGDASVVRGAPTSYFQKLPTTDTISLYPVPDTTLPDGITVRAAYAPTVTAATVPDVLFNTWVEQISLGAIARLTSMASQPFFSAGTSAEYRTQFLLAVRAAGIQARSGKSAAASKVQSVGFV